MAGDCAQRQPTRITAVDEEENVDIHDVVIRQRAAHADRFAAEYMSLFLWVEHVLEVSGKTGDQQSYGGQSKKKLS